MAPPPEYDKEPKAPDKNLTNNSTDDSKVLYNHIKDHPTNPDHKAVTAGANDVVNDKYVETLDDGQLRALLDEAINYKCPKDREGKSSLFKNLLQEAEEQECEAATRDLGAGRGGRRGRGRHEHHSSLQDLVAAIAGETAPRRGRAHGHAHAHTAPPAATVSARAHHGGSLPSGVDKSFLLSEEASRYEVGGAARGGYLATVRCVNPPPLAERRVSAGDANAPEPAPAPPAPPAPPPAAPAAHPAAHPAAADDARRRAPMFPMTYTARATLEIGSGSVCSGRAVTTTTASNQVDSAIPFSCITTPEVVTSCNTTSSTSTVAVDPKPRSVISSNFNGLPLVRPASTTFSNIDEYKKSLDENGNAVQGFNSPLSGSSQHKKPRRKKSSKNETIIKSQEIDGYQGNKDLNEVLRFIESHADGARAPAAKLRAKHHDDERAAKKRSTERRKDKEPKLKRASSLEELSRTTLEELTAAPAPPKPERRSWGDAADADAAPAPHELTDFQTVTKKRKPRRRADDAPEARARARPSAPASDRSNDSNDDADSVTSPPAPPPPPPPPPAPSAPHASYADIARTRHNIPDLIESCNYCAAAPQPAAGAARARKAGKRKEPDVVADRRPAVVLAAGARPRDMDGVTFGFDVNEQLLGGGGCDLLREAEGAGPAAWAALRYVAPAPPPDTQHLHQIIDYVGAAWDDVVRCGGGKVRYFSE